MKSFKILVISLFLTSCAQSSGVLKMGPDTYTVSIHAAPARGGIPGAKKLALTEANNHCTTLNKEIFVTNINSYPSSHFPGGTADITFRCLSSSDSALHRPVYQKAPDLVIENR